MLLLDLHYFYKILSTPYDKLYLFFKNKYNLNDNILENIYLKKFFYSIWLKKLNLSFNKFKTSYKFKIIENNYKLIKIHFIHHKIFSLANYPKNFLSHSIDEYILILQKQKLNYKVIFLVNKEDTPKLYEEMFKRSLVDFSLDPLNKINIWNSKIKLIDPLHNKYLKTFSCYRSNPSTQPSTYNAIFACNYAEKFALKSNDEYISFDGNGGDCTNFISQCIHAGGLKTTNTWKPYSNSWVRVEDLYQYIINNKLGFQVKENFNLKKGNIIQFYTPKIGRFSHSAIITYSIPDIDHFYCCHSYNKLNYPLSLTYPILYPKIRVLELH